MKKLLFLISLSAVLVPTLSFAAYFKAGNVLSVNPSETIRDNVYVAGGNVVVSNTIDGDLFVVGSMLFVSAKVDQDITLAGGTIIVSGASGEDIRVGGGNITIGGNFSGELMLAGGQIIITPDTQIKKDSYIAGGGVTFNGKEEGDLTIAAGTVFINGTIEKNLKIKNAKEIKIGSGAVIKGNLEYFALSEAVVENGAQILGVTTFHKIEKAGAFKKSGAVFGSLFGLFTLLSLAKLLMILTVAYLLWYIWRKDSNDVVQLAKSHFGRSLLKGFLFLVAVPVAVIISIVTIIGVLPGIFGLLLYGAILILGAPFAVLFTASLIAKNRADFKWFHILLGAVVMMVVSIIPFVGWLAIFIVYLAALGALLGILKPKFQRSA